MRSEGQRSCCRDLCPYFCVFELEVRGVGRILVVRVCVVAPPMALCGTSRGCLVADRAAASGRPPIRVVCVVALPPVRGVGGLSLGLCSPPWMAVMGPGSALTVVWWIMMMVVVVLSLSEERKGTNIYVGWRERITNLRADVTAQTCGLMQCISQWHRSVNTFFQGCVDISPYIKHHLEHKLSPTVLIHCEPTPFSMANQVLPCVALHWKSTCSLWNSLLLPSIDDQKKFYKERGTLDTWWRCTIKKIILSISNIADVYKISFLSL